MEQIQVFVVLSRNSTEAVLTLEDDKPKLEAMFAKKDAQRISGVYKMLESMVSTAGGNLVDSSMTPWKDVTIHPIGGACMSRDDGSLGVTDHCGQVFRGDGYETHTGLVVMDGSLIPGPLCANPMATIVALAERNAQMYADNHSLSIDWKKNDALDLFGEPEYKPHDDELDEETIMKDNHTEPVATDNKSSARFREIQSSSLKFKELMSGHIHIAKETEKQDRTTNTVHDNAWLWLDVLINPGDEETASLSGRFVCHDLPGSPFMVKGSLKSFVLSSGTPGNHESRYDCIMVGVNGQTLKLDGRKLSDFSIALSPSQLWKASTTLHCTITDSQQVGDDDGSSSAQPNQVIAQGSMYYKTMDLIPQVIRSAEQGRGIMGKLRSSIFFLKYLTKTSWPAFLTPLAPLKSQELGLSGYFYGSGITESLRIDVESMDKVSSCMYMWEPRNSTIATKNLLLIPGAAMDHHLFTLPTIQCNAVNYFTRAGYRVFVGVHRLGGHPMRKNSWTTYDARLDIRVCLSYIRDNYSPLGRPPEGTYVVAHCVGSLALASGLLDGSIPASWISGVTSSQVFMNPTWKKLQGTISAKAAVLFPSLYKTLAGPRLSLGSQYQNTFSQRAINQLLRLYRQERQEACNEVTCHRVSLILGRAWNHRNLNDSTHRNLYKFFGGVSMTMLDHLIAEGFEGNIRDNNGLDLATPENIQRLQGLPILLLAGSENAVLGVEAISRSYDLLNSTLGSSGSSPLLQKRVIDGYGHDDCWIGESAWRDVYPTVRKEVDRIVRGESYRFEVSEEELMSSLNHSLPERDAIMEMKLKHGEKYVDPGRSL
jgi:hypothetical protein